MKLLLVIFAVVLAKALAEEHKNPGFKFRFTQKAFDEFLRTHQAMMGDSPEKAKRLFNIKMKKMLKEVKSIQAGLIIADKLELKDAELINYDKGTGSKVMLKEPNIMEISHNDVGINFKVNAVAKGKAGTVNINVKNVDITMGIALTASKKGNLQLESSQCQLSIESAKVTFNGYGDEKDKLYTTKAQEKLDALIGALHQLLCPRMQQAMVTANMYLDMADCTIKLPDKIGSLRFSMCQTGNPKATSDYMEFYFCGATIREGEGMSDDYKPAPLAMSDEGTSKMFYVWEAEAVPNTFMKKWFEERTMVVELKEDKFPMITSKIKAALKEHGHITNDNADVKTILKAAEAPALSYKADKPNSIAGSFKIRAIHQIKDCEDECPEKEVSCVMGIDATITFEVDQSEEGKMFPKIKNKLALEKLTISETQPPIPAARKTQMEKKAKKGLEKALNDIMNNVNDAFYEQHEKYMPPPMRVFQVKDFALKLLDKTAEMSASIKFDEEKLIELNEKYSDMFF